MKKLFKDFYGCSACIGDTRKGSRLVIRTSFGKKIKDKIYGTERGAKIAMGRMSDGWSEVSNA